MERLLFRQLPWAVRLAVGVAYYNAWVCIEEFIIDRNGLWKYMPYYRKGEGCVWDLAVGLIIAFGIWHFSTRAAPPAVTRAL
jgi:hypothetical protein